MPVILSWGGNPIPYSENNEQGWGEENTATIVAINQYCIQSTGGTYSLQADLNFGTNFGLVSKYYKSDSANISQCGILRLSNTDGIGFRNFGNNGDLLLTTNSANQLLWNGTIVASGGANGNVIGPNPSVNSTVPVFGGTTGTVLLDTPVTIDSSGNVGNVLNLTGSTGTLGSASIGTLTIGTSATAPTLGSTDNSTNVATTAFVQTVVSNQVSTAVPPGVTFDYWGTSAPSGYLMCFGQFVGTATYPNLFGVIGYTIGSSAGSFQIPDYRGRVAAGVDNMGGTAANRITSLISGINGATLGATGGDQNLSLHTHIAKDLGHTHTPSGGGVFLTSGNAATTATPGATNYGSEPTTSVGSANIQINNTGAGTSQNVQPTIMCNKIIKF